MQLDEFYLIFSEKKGKEVFQAKCLDHMEYLTGRNKDPHVKAVVERIWAVTDRAYSALYTTCGGNEDTRLWHDTFMKASNVLSPSCGTGALPGSETATKL